MEEITNNEQMSHTQRLEEIDREQREKETAESNQSSSNAFAESILEAVDVNSSNIETPLLTQEEIEDEEPPRVNMTAVVCTAIVAVCATIILCVAHPWKNDRVTPEENRSESNEVQKPENNPVPEQVKNVEPVKKVEPVKEVKTEKPEAKPETKPEQVNPVTSTLPVVKSIKTGTQNPYNNVRLIDASSRMLTKSEVEQMTKAELALARNSIYARHGYQFNNAELREFFAKQKWFKGTDIKMEDIQVSDVEMANINLIKGQENKK